MQDIESGSCSLCVFAHRDPAFPIGQYVCRRNPPTVHLIPTQGVAGVVMNAQPIFPPVSAKDWCGEFDDGLEDAEGE